MANPYIPKLGPSAATALPGLPRRKSTVVTSISAAFNWQQPVVYSGLSFSVNAQEPAPHRAKFSTDGFEMYILGTTNRTVYQYSLTVAGDVSTASYASKSINVGGSDSNAIGLAFSVDGTNMYMCGTTTDTVYPYILSTPWDLSTAVLDAGNIKSVSAETTSPVSLVFSTDGLGMYILDNSTNTVLQYTLSTAWLVSSASHVATTFIGLSGPTDIHLSPLGDKLYAISSPGTEDVVSQFTLATEFDILTASDDGITFNVSPQDAQAQGVSFSVDGTTMYMVGITNFTVYQYTVGDYT